MEIPQELLEKAVQVKVRYDIDRAVHLSEVSVAKRGLIYKTFVDKHHGSLVTKMVEWVRTYDVVVPEKCAKCGKTPATHPGSHGTKICKECCTDECHVAIGRARAAKRKAKNGNS